MYFYHMPAVQLTRTKRHRDGVVFWCNRTGQPRAAAIPWSRVHRTGAGDAPGHLRRMVHGLDRARVGWRRRQRHYAARTHSHNNNNNNNRGDLALVPRHRLHHPRADTLDCRPHRSPRTSLHPSDKSSGTRARACDHRARAVVVVRRGRVRRAGYRRFGHRVLYATTDSEIAAAACQSCVCCVSVCAYAVCVPSSYAQYPRPRGSLAPSFSRDYRRHTQIYARAPTCRRQAIIIIYGDTGEKERAHTPPVDLACFTPSARGGAFRSAPPPTLTTPPPLDHVDRLLLGAPTSLTIFRQTMCR